MRKKQIFTRTFHELTGCIHNHTEYSFDSVIKIEKILKAAKNNDLDYITINDHMTLDAAKDESVLNEKEIIVIVGSEVNDETNNNHFLVYNVDKILQERDAKKYVSSYIQNGAIGFAAHPHEKRACSILRKYIWTDIANDDFTGLEVWNALSDWVSRMNPRLNGLFLVLFPSFFIKKPLRENLRYWDSLNNSGKRKVAIGSVDAHSETFKKWGIKFVFLTHNSLFKTVRTNLLINEKEEINEENILNAIKKGNSYIVNYKMGNPYNFYAGIKSENQNAIFGEEIEFSDDLKFYFRLPKNAKVKLFRNGIKSEKIYDEKGFFPITKKGNYRLEITRFGRGWIYTNNIYVV